MRFAGERHRHQRAAVKSVFEADDGGTLGVSARDFHGVFDGFGAGIEQDRFLREISRRERVQFFGDGDVAFVRRDGEAEMQMLLELLFDCGGDARRLMADVEAADAAGEIDVAIAVNVGERGAFSGRGENRDRVVWRARDGGFAAFHQRDRARAWDFRLDLNCGHFQYHPIGVSSRFTKTCLVSRYSSSPHGPSSRPKPDCL